MSDTPQKSTGGLQSNNPYEGYLQSSYAPDQGQQYVSDLVHSFSPSIAPHGRDSGYIAPPAYAPTTVAHYTPEQAVALYNAMDPALANDPVMAAALNRAHGYFEQGQFDPGAKTATVDLLNSAQKQWAVDDADKAKNSGLFMGLMTAAVGGLGAAGAMGAGAAGAAPFESGFTGTGALSGAGGVGADLGAASALGGGASTLDSAAAYDAGLTGVGSNVGAGSLDGALTTTAGSGAGYVPGASYAPGALGSGTADLGLGDISSYAAVPAVGQGAPLALADVGSGTGLGSGLLGGATNSAGYLIGDGSAAAGTAGFGPAASSSIFDNIKNPFVNPDGSYNLSNILAAAGTGIGLAGKIGQTTPTIKSLSDLGAVPWTGGGTSGGTSGGGSGGFGSSFTPAQMAAFSTPFKAGDQLSRIYSADMKSPMVSGVSTRKYAEGGPIQGALTQSAPFVGFVQGDGGGQADLIDANLSAGEYVFDAESVSMLGDGNNAEGAKKLDELRQQLRAQKRSAPNDQIAPPAQGPLSYIGGQNG